MIVKMLSHDGAKRGRHSMFRLRGRQLLAPPMLGLQLFAGAVVAQERQTPALRLPEVVVMGTNVPAPSPVASTALTGAQLKVAGMSSTLDLPRAVPNLSQSHAGLRSFSDTYVIRGLGN